MARNVVPAVSGPPNAGNHPIDSLFGVPGVPFNHTGAPGSSSAMDGSGAWSSDRESGVVQDSIATAANPYESSQAPRPSTYVQQGDVNMVGQYPDEMPITNSALGSSGVQPTVAGQAGDGGYSSDHVVTSPHPNAAGLAGSRPVPRMPHEPMPTAVGYEV